MLHAHMYITVHCFDFTACPVLTGPALCCCLVQILEEQHALFFHLQQQRLIELIRQGKTEEALQFAQEYLAPHGEENEAFLEELGEQGQTCRCCCCCCSVALGRPFPGEAMSCLLTCQCALVSVFQ